MVQGMGHKELASKPGLPTHQTNYKSTSKAFLFNFGPFLLASVWILRRAKDDGLVTFGSYDRDPQNAR